MIHIQEFTLGRSVLGLLAVTVILFRPAPARADDDDAAGSTNRVKRPIEELFKSDVVFPQESGELEVEAASIYRNHAGGDTWTLPLSLEYGINERWQVEAEWDSWVRRFPAHQSAVSGLGDVEAGTQYSFLNLGGSDFHLAPRFSLGIPAGDVNKDLSEGFLEYEPAVILARDFPELHRTQIFTEIGASIPQRVKRPAEANDAEPAAAELNWGVGGFVLFPHAAATLEYNWSNSTWNHHGTENAMYLTPGCLWRVARHVELGLGMPVGLNNASDRFEVVAHVVWEF